MGQGQEKTGREGWVRGKSLASSDLTSAIAGSGSASAASGFSSVPWTTKNNISFFAGICSPWWRDRGDNLDRLDDPEVARRRVDGERLQLQHLLPSLSPPLLSFPPDIEASWGCRHYERRWVIVVVLNDRNDLLKRLRSSCCHLLVVNIRIK